MGFNDLKKTRQSCDTVRRRVVQTFLTPTFCEIICKSILFFAAIVHSSLPSLVSNFVGDSFLGINDLYK